MVDKDEYGTDASFRRKSLYGAMDEPTYSGALSFMRRKYTRDLSGVDLVVWGVPYDIATTNRPGSRFGPRAIRQASSILSWDPACDWLGDPYEKLAVIDYGDADIDFGVPDQLPRMIEEQAAEILSHDVGVLTLGGDHFITWPLLKAHAAKHGPLSLIHFDAHSDTWPDDEGEPRIDHGTMFYHAVKEGLIDPKTSVQVGLRTTNADTLGFHVLSAPWVHHNGTASTVKAIRDVIGEQKAYLTFDIDCLDPAFAPGTGTPVIGGLSSHQGLEILRGLLGLKIVGMDMVEVAPAYDVGEITALAGATLANTMVRLYAENYAKA